MELTFLIGSSIRKVYIKDKTITFITPELKFFPFKIELDKINLNDPKNKKLINKNLLNNEIFSKINKLKGEEEIAKDIIDDFQKSGWRLVNKV